MWELDYTESWALEEWCFWTAVLEKTLESCNSNTLATWCKELTPLKRPWCWERLRAGGEGDDRGRDGWMASSTGWTWVWMDSRSWWWTGRPGMLQFMGSQRVGHDWVTELSLIQFELSFKYKIDPLLFFCIWQSSFPKTISWREPINCI